jgi:hypothetical protein
VAAYSRKKNNFSFNFFFKKLHRKIIKKIFTLLLCSILFLIHPANAQDISKNAAIKQINKTSVQADKLYGKKIQQQTLSTNSFVKMSTLKLGKTK